MNTTTLQINIPLDDDGYLRRECPLCLREFKVFVDDKDRQTIQDEIADTYLLDVIQEGDTTSDVENEPSEFFCPYCGQEAGSDSWWTKEQIVYATAAAQNVAIEAINREFLQPLRRRSRQYGSRNSGLQLKVEARDLPKEPEWIAPEANDMEMFDLPCCDQRIKIDETWNDVVHCFYCGFPHLRASS